MNPDPQVIATARLFENLAVVARHVRNHAAEEYARVDSLPTQTPGANPTPMVSPTRPLAGECQHNIPNPENPDELIDCGHTRPCPDHDTPVHLTATERAAAERERIRHWLDDFEGRIRLAATIGHQLLNDAHKFIGTRTALGVQLECRDGIHGKDLSAALTGDIAICTRHADKSGLCNRHYMAWWRERQATATREQV